jgi:PAS domain S-box-containing protein
MTQQGLFPSVILKIIEEFTDGFLIVDGRGEVVFFNEVFLKLTGWRSDEVLSRQGEILRGVEWCKGGEAPDRACELLTPRGGGIFLVSCFAVDSDRGTYRMLRVREHGEGSSRSNYDLLFNNAGDALVSVDLTGRILAANPSYYRLIGAERDKAPRTLRELFASTREFEERAVRLLEAGSLFNSEIHIRTADGQLKRVLDTSWVTRDEKGVVSGYTCQMRDITYLKNLEQRLEIAERNYIKLFGTVLSSIVIVDPDGIILNWNFGAEELYGYRWEEVVGRVFDEVVGLPPERPPMAAIMAMAADNGGRLVETGVSRTCKGGAQRFVYVAYRELRNSLSELLAYSIEERDLTESVRLEQKLKESFERIKKTQLATIRGFAKFTELRDNETKSHLDRISNYARVLASRLRENPRYANYITDGYIEDLCLSAILHDVGKVGVADSILVKPGKLTPEEYTKMKEHARLGGDALSVIDDELREESFLTLGKEIAYHHHEWWDGSGYPDGRKGDQIPLSARIVALADVYDALTTERPYKQAFSHEDAVGIIGKERATHFDPDIVDVFLRHHETFNRIKLFREFEERPENIANLLSRQE